LRPYTCCFPNCQTLIEARHLACMSHWGPVPKAVKREVQVRRCSWRNREAALTYLKSHFLAEIRKALPVVELPSPKPADAAAAIGIRNVRLAVLLKAFDSALAELEA